MPPRHVAFVDFGSSSLQVAIAAFHKGKVKVIDLTIIIIIIVINEWLGSTN